MKKKQIIWLVIAAAAIAAIVVYYLRRRKQYAVYRAAEAAPTFLHGYGPINLNATLSAESEDIEGETVAAQRMLQVLGYPVQDNGTWDAATAAAVNDLFGREDTTLFELRNEVVMQYDDEKAEAIIQSVEN